MEMPLDPQQITNRIIALAQERNIRRISLVGYSAGGVVAMEVAEKLYEQSNLQLQAIIPTSTPDGEEGLRPEQLQTKDILMTAADIIPGSKYSTPIRYIGEMAFRMNMYNDGDLAERWQDFWQTSDDVSTAMKEARLPGTWLLVDQTLAISNARLQERITHIAELSQDRLQPVIIYLGTAKPGYDTMVNDTDSGENICAYATEANLRCLIYDVPGAIHNRPDLATDAFEATIKAAKQDIHQALNGALAAYVLTRPIKEGLAPSYLEDPTTSSGGVLASDTSSQSVTPSS